MMLYKVNEDDGSLAAHSGSIREENRFSDFLFLILSRQKKSGIDLKLIECAALFQPVLK